MPATALTEVAPAMGYRVSRRWAWQGSSVCGPEDEPLFFPDEMETLEVTALREELAKELCSWCTVADPCRRQGLARPEVAGIWGGLTEAEREDIRRRAAQAVRVAEREGAPSPPPPPPAAPGLRTCTKCGVEKPVKEFRQVSWSKDGLNTQCKKCVNATRKAQRAAAKNPPQITCEHAEEATAHAV